MSKRERSDKERERENIDRWLNRYITSVKKSKRTKICRLSKGQVACSISLFHRPRRRRRRKSNVINKSQENTIVQRNLYC